MKALKDKSLERRTKLVEQGREQQIKSIKGKKFYWIHSIVFNTEIVLFTVKQTSSI